MKRIIFCGGRDYSDRAHVFRVCRDLLAQHGDYMVVQGGADGADALAKEFARQHPLPYLTVPADWKQHGRSAGPRRNAEMLTIARPSLVVAFPGGKGTRNMVMQAESAGVQIFQAWSGPS